MEEAQTVPVYLGEDARNVDVRPMPGKLLSLAGSAGPIPDGFTTTVTLASDMGRRSSGNPFSFGGLPPGPYEVYVEARENPPGTRLMGGYTQLNLDRVLTNFAVAMREMRETQFESRGGGDAPNVMARRKDMAGTGNPKALQLNNNRALLAPGRWELMVLLPPGYYITQFAPTRRDGNARPDGWNEVTILGNSSVRANLSGGASSVHGVVKISGAPVVGAPVFLEAWNPDTRKRPTELRFTRTGVDGTYRIESLAPGTYRVLATFEYLAPDSTSRSHRGGRVQPCLPQSARMRGASPRVVFPHPASFRRRHQPFGPTPLESLSFLSQAEPSLGLKSDLRSMTWQSARCPLSIGQRVGAAGGSERSRLDGR